MKGIKYFLKNTFNKNKMKLHFSCGARNMGCFLNAEHSDYEAQETKTGNSVAWNPHPSSWNILMSYFVLKQNV